MMILYTLYDINLSSKDSKRLSINWPSKFARSIKINHFQNMSPSTLIRTDYAFTANKILINRKTGNSNNYLLKTLSYLNILTSLNGIENFETNHDLRLKWAR